MWWYSPNKYKNFQGWGRWNITMEAEKMFMAHLQVVTSNCKDHDDGSLGRAGEMENQQHNVVIWKLSMPSTNKRV